MAKPSPTPAQQTVLVVNTTFKGIALAIFRHTFGEAVGQNQLLSARFVAESHKAALTLPRLVDELMADAHLDWPQLDGICVAHGPGSFTGIKIGIAFAQGLVAGAAGGVRLLGVDALGCLSRYGDGGTGVGTSEDAEATAQQSLWVMAQNRRKGYIYADGSDAPTHCVWLIPPSPRQAAAPTELWVTPADAQVATDPRRTPWPGLSGQRPTPWQQPRLVTPWPELEAALPQGAAPQLPDSASLAPASLAKAVLAAMATAYSLDSSKGAVEANYITPSTPEERIIALKLADKARGEGE